MKSKSRIFAENHPYIPMSPSPYLSHTRMKQPCQEEGVFEPIAFCPGYLRGLAFSGDFAIVGLSKPRNNFKTDEIRRVVTIGS